MCLAIYKPADTLPDWDAYENGCDSNKDGWGFSAVKDGEIITIVGIEGFDQFRREFTPYADCQAIIHFRLATDGDVMEANCHPFIVSGETTMIHNGCIRIDMDLNDKMSDTWHFVELLMKPLAERDRDFFLRPEVRWPFEKAEAGSKFVFLRADGSAAIWNEKSGHWHKDGHWYSNHSYTCSYGRYVGYYASDSKYTTAYKSKPDRWWETETDDEILGEQKAAVAEPITVGIEAVSESLGMDDKDWEEVMEDRRTRFEYDLALYGLRQTTLQDVRENLGFDGIEVLHELID